MSSEALRRWLPQPIRRAGGRLRAGLVRSEIRGELQRLARGSRPIVAGPWLGEVGFEILYWIPFLRWFVSSFDVDPLRVVAISRGGPASWYRDVAGRYVEVFDHVTVDQFRQGNERRRLELGEQKQVRAAAFDSDILRLVAESNSLADAEVLHPSTMYRLFQPYWWKHAGPDWVAQHTRYTALPKPGFPSGLDATPGEYIAVKFYFNDCVPDDDRTRRFASEVMARLSEIAPVVSLSTELGLDDHAGAREEVSGRLTSIAPLVEPRNNLGVQTAVLAHARAFVGTYGGFSYLPPLHGVPTIGLYAEPQGFDRAHLVMAQRAFAGIGAPCFETRDLRHDTPDDVAGEVARATRLTA